MERVLAFMERFVNDEFEIARNLLEMNLDIDSIMKATGLIKKEVEALK